MKHILTIEENIQSTRNRKIHGEALGKYILTRVKGLHRSIKFKAKSIIRN